MGNKIIGLAGFKGSGKDTLAGFLVGMGFVKDSFAKSVKDVLSIVFSWDRDKLEGLTVEDREWREIPDTWWEEKLDWKNNKWSTFYKRFTPRVAMTCIGTEIFRNEFSDEIWKLSLERRITRYDNVVITDVRFPNEIKLIKENNGKLIRIKRGPEPFWFQDAIKAAKGDENSIIKMTELGIHPSEYLWLAYTFDATIENDTSPEKMLIDFKSII